MPYPTLNACATKCQWWGWAGVEAHDLHPPVARTGLGRNSQTTLIHLVLWLGEASFPPSAPLCSSPSLCLCLSVPLSGITPTPLLPCESHLDLLSLLSFTQNSLGPGLNSPLDFKALCLLAQETPGSYPPSPLMKAPGTPQPSLCFEDPSSHVLNVASPLFF